MSLPTRHPQRRAVTASAAKLRGGNESTNGPITASLHWQHRALDYYDRIGELRYASHFYARQLSSVRYYPATLEDDGTATPIDSGAPVDLLNRIQDPGGGRTRLQFDYGRLMFVTGEGVLFGSNLDTEAERWRFLWREEIKMEDGVAYRVNLQQQKTGEQGVAYRMWTPHPRHSDEADSPLRPVLDIAEELIILTASVRGTATTRLTNGLLIMASELSPAPSDPGLDEDPEQNIFLQDLISHITAQIDNPGSPESKVPFIIEGSFDYIRDGIRWEKTHDPATDYMERDLRIEAVKRMALGLDMPPEALLGMTDANHWTAKQVQHDMWRAHGAPIADRLADDLSEAYLRPALMAEGYADWNKVVVEYDDSQVVISPDRTEDANSAADRGMISDEGYRELMGISEDMAPSPDELDRFLAIKLRDPAIIDPALAPTPSRGPVAGPSDNGNAADGPPAPTGGRTGSRQEARTASIVGAAALAIRQCRARAGARLRTHAKGCAQCA